MRTLAAMPRKKSPTPDNARPLPDGRVTPKFMVRLPEEFRAPLEALAKENFRTVTGEVTTILFEKLRSLGLLPSKGGPNSGEGS
ncbi:MAG TPA: Arc family DNA-binding protein [Pirellulales bacterium]